MRPVVLRRALTEIETRLARELAECFWRNCGRHGGRSLIGGCWWSELRAIRGRYKAWELMIGW